ncbi:hypothetical protein J2741_001892 [Methanolinea mesophila]|uniref:hypothetical protein n=1 Tax=Methanolinea mesophila TaxID=547055 RepID=UPI001AE71D8B|nr:hypothetical protein [Methanolinea mesophila]MBP1929345.1 hypothetical protein [Methanolinea mesophila]
MRHFYGVRPAPGPSCTVEFNTTNVEYYWSFGIRPEEGMWLVRELNLKVKNYGEINVCVRQGRLEET